MDQHTRLFTQAQAAALSGLSLKAVQQAIDKHVVEPAAETGVSGTRRVLTNDDVVRLRVWRGVGGALSPDRRRNLFLQMADHPDAETFRADDVLIVDVGEARRQVSARARDLDEAAGVIHSDKAIMGGEPVFKGTRIQVHAIAAMLDAGADVEELLEGYPMLDARKLGLSRLWAAAHPRRGRSKRLSELGLTVRSTTRVAAKPDPLPRRPGPEANSGQT